MQTEANGKERDYLRKFAHDIRTPLTVIGQFLTFISPQIMDGDAGVFLKAAALSLDKAVNLVDAVKTVKSSQKISKSSCDVAGLIKNIFNQFRPQAEMDKVKLSYVGPDHLICSVDQLAMERVVANLVKNAFEASDKPQGYVEVRLFQNGSSVLIEVHDNGRGVSKENLGKIFINGFTYGKENGTGTGLANCKEIVDSHGGKISAHSKEGIGAVFSIELPDAALIMCNQCENFEKKSSSLLQIYVNDAADKNMNSWLSLWKSAYNTERIRVVKSHQFTECYQEDSIGFYS